MVTDPDARLAVLDRGSSNVRLSEILSALSYALDITEGQPVGHAVRSCLIGMRVAEAVGVPARLRPSLFHALLMKDLGCSSNAARICTLFGTDDRMAKRAHKLSDWSSWLGAAQYALRVTDGNGLRWSRLTRLGQLGLRGGAVAREVTAIRCERGADIAAMMGFSRETATAIRALDEHWDGRGYPDGLSGTAIPLLGRIMCLAQTVEVFFTTCGLQAALEIAERRRGTWFDPNLVDALLSLRIDRAFWNRLKDRSVLAHVSAVEPPNDVVHATEDRVDRITAAFARVIDAKSPWTSRHSERVAEVAVGMAYVLGYDATALRELRWAARLHDIGKLGVPNTILDKAGPLTDAELRAVRRHPAYTVEILRRVERFRRLAEIAGSHHERLDGSGYHRGLTGEQITPPARILVVADMYEALTAERPYRPRLPPERALAMLRDDANRGICGECVEALRVTIES